jgi:MFS-type transporter involved in bile tolerance (Atg22 family)
MIALPIMALGESMVMWIILAILLGLLIGAMWATSRAYMSILVAKEDL